MWGDFWLLSERWEAGLKRSHRYIESPAVVAWYVDSRRDSSVIFWHHTSNNAAVIPEWRQYQHEHASLSCALKWTFYQAALPVYSVVMYHTKPTKLVLSLALSIWVPRLLCRVF